MKAEAERHLMRLHRWLTVWC